MTSGAQPFPSPSSAPTGPAEVCPSPRPVPFSETVDEVDRLVADCRELLRWFSRHGEWIGWAGIGTLGLWYTPEMLCRLGILKPKRLGRWDEGWGPGPGLSDA